MMFGTNRAKLFGAVMIAAAGLAACAPMEGRETSGQYVDDATVTTKVKASIVNEQALKGFDIHVETMKDVVQLSGFVGTAQQKAQAEQIARGVSGVRGVRNDIVVR